MLLTSGQKQRPRLAQQIYRFMLDQEPLLGAATITVHHRRLTAEGVVGWQQQEDDLEFLVEVDRDLPRSEYVVTLIHELIHCRQTLEGLMDDAQREQEAYSLETVYAARFAAARSLTILSKQQTPCSSPTTSPPTTLPARKR